MARTTPQELKCGTQWPQWAQTGLFRLALLKHARALGSCHFSNTRLLTGHRTSRHITVHVGFIPSPVMTRKTRKGETKTVACETAIGCPFQVVIARTKTSHSHQFHTEQTMLDHNHEVWSWDESEQAKWEHGRLQEEVKATVAALKVKAQEELKNLRKSADVFACSTVPAGPNELSPTSEQECAIQDLGDALGEDIGRRFETEMRQLGLLSDDYPVSPNHKLGSSIPADAVPYVSPGPRLRGSRTPLMPRREPELLQILLFRRPGLCRGPRTKAARTDSVVCGSRPRARTNGPRRSRPRPPSRRSRTPATMALSASRPGRRL